MEYIVGGLATMGIFFLLYVPALFWQDRMQSRWSRYNRDRWLKTAYDLAHWAWQRGYESGYSTRDAEMGTD